MTSTRTEPGLYQRQWQILYHTPSPGDPQSGKEIEFWPEMQLCPLVHTLLHQICLTNQGRFSGSMIRPGASLDLDGRVDARSPKLTIIIVHDKPDRASTAALALANQCLYNHQTPRSSSRPQPSHASLEAGHCREPQPVVVGHCSLQCDDFPWPKVLPHLYWPWSSFLGEIKTKLIQSRHLYPHPLQTQHLSLAGFSSLCRAKHHPFLPHHLWHHLPL